MPFATNGGIRIHYEADGNGPPLVLHVGYMGRLEDWRREDVGVAQALRDEYQLILLDPRGFGASDKPHESSAYALDQIAGDVIAVLDSLGVDKADFWGYSRGAGIGFALGSLKPDRFRSLILGGAHPYGADPGVLIERAEVLRTGGMAAFIDWFEQRVGTIPAEVQAVWRTNDPLALAAIEDAASARKPAGIDPSTIELPALLYCGTEDPPHDRMNEAARAMSRATFVSVPGLNHALTFRRDGVSFILPRVRAFLAELSAQTSSSS